MQQKDVVRIIVNAQERIVPFNQLSVTGEISYEKLITLAFDAGDLPGKRDLMFTITYRMEQAVRQPVLLWRAKAQKFKMTLSSMSQQLIDRSPDLKRLVDEGYEVEIESGHLLLRHVPYVTKGKGIKYGTLVSRLTLAGDVTTKPEDHVVMFAGDLPCDSDGKPLIQIQASDRRQQLGEG